MTTYPTLTLVRAISETHDTKSFYFKPSLPITYQAGNFINIKIEVDGETHQRAYSISSIPSDDFFRITVKRVATGVVSNWLNDHLRIGDSIETNGIGGGFSMNLRTLRKNLIFISGGSAVPSLHAMATELSQQSGLFDSIQFVHCARDAENIIFQEEMYQLKSPSKNISLKIFLDTLNAPSTTQNCLLQGPLSLEALATLLGDHKDDTTIYLCGPYGLVLDVQKKLETLNFDLKNVDLGY